MPSGSDSLETKLSFLVVGITMALFLVSCGEVGRGHVGRVRSCFCVFSPPHPTFELESSPSGISPELSGDFAVLVSCFSLTEEIGR